MRPFQVARIPPLRIGPGRIAELPELLPPGEALHILLVTGGTSLERSGHLLPLLSLLEDLGHQISRARFPGEPSVAQVDTVRDRFREDQVDVVVGIGGGSVVDAGKAISAMLPHEHSVLTHLEGVGRGIPHPGEKVPYLAVPTTSGTGSEVTKNAVLSEVGPEGYKKSLRHEALVPDGVILDPELMTSCPPALTAACGLDAFTQLLEPWLSPRCSPLTEALAWSGLQALGANLPRACSRGAGDLGVRQAVAYGALLSGICLANDGLGILHGLAGPLGALHPVPHGSACAALLAPSVRANLRALRERIPDSPALEKMARLGRFLGGEPELDRDQGGDALLSVLETWRREFSVPGLAALGLEESDLPLLASRGANRGNPVALDETEILALLRESLES